MAMCRPNVLKSVALVALMAAAPAAIGTLAPLPAQAQAALPAPYVSRALDAVLLPVNGSVIAAFGLAPGTTGVLVLATQPGGLADSAGVLPGDVLDYVRGTAILSPADLDLIIYNWILEGITDFLFDGLRGGETFSSETLITLEYWEETIEITEVASWESYSYESFSYEEFYSEYSEEMTASYEETSYEESATEEAVSEEVATEEEFVDEGMVEEGTVDEMPAEEGYEDAPVEDYAEEPVDAGGEEEFVDDGGGEEFIDEGGGDEGGGEEEFIE